MFHFPNPPRPGTCHSEVKVRAGNANTQAVIYREYRNNSGLRSQLPDVSAYDVVDHFVSKNVSGGQDANSTRHRGLLAACVDGEVSFDSRQFESSDPRANAVLAHGEPPASAASPTLIVIRTLDGTHYLAGPGGTPDTYAAIPARQTREGAWLPRAGAVSRLVRKAGCVVVEGRTNA